MPSRSGTSVHLGAVTVRYVYSEAARPYSLIEWIAPAGTESPPVHIHHRTDEGFYVLDGTFGFLLDDQRFEAAAGSHVFVSRGHPHTFWNSGRELATCLIVLSPAGFEEYFRELADGLAASESDDAVMAVRRRLSSRYDIEVVGPPIPAR
ncbi:MAG TPA: cupin domain-containing protein [Candidatus Dormibacteraeota bacterium]